MKNTSSVAALAIHGGEPVRNTPMPYRAAFGKEEAARVSEVIAYYQSKDQDPPYQGHFENLFCDAFVDYMGGGFADAVATGTASVFVALAALELPAKSEVIISPVTDSGPLNCIIMQDLVPVVADSKPNSYNMGVDEFLARITPRTSAVLAVHCAGEPLEIDRLVTEAHKRGIKVLEDASQAPGAVWAGKKVGTYGDSAAFSTMYRKTLTAGASGGLVYARDRDLYRRALAHADRGKQTWRTDINLNNPGSALFPALNFNTDEISCAIGIASLQRLPNIITRRVSFLSQLCVLLEQKTITCKPYAFHNDFSPFFFPIFVDITRLDCSKIDFAKAVQAEGIGLLPDYGCIVSEWPWAKKYLSDSFITHNAVSTRDRSFNLFINEQYGEEELADIINAIVKVEHYFLKAHHL